MKNILILITALFIGMLVSCSNRSNKNKIETAAATHADTVKFTANMVDNKRDPSCGMPASAGFEDTVHYKNKVIGFCSKECKDEFLKNPAKNITAADLKP